VFDCASMRQNEMAWEENRLSLFRFLEKVCARLECVLRQHAVERVPIRSDYLQRMVEDIGAKYALPPAGFKPEIDHSRRMARSLDDLEKIEQMLLIG